MADNRRENARRLGATKGHRHREGDKLKPLSRKEERFVIEYTTHWNATRAAMNAGIISTGNRLSAGVEGSKLLKKPSVKAMIEQHVSRILGDKEQLRARVIEELKALAFSDIKDVVDYRGNGSPLAVRDLEEIDSRAIQSIERQPVVTNSQGVVDHVVKVRLHEKKGALDTLSKYLGMLKDEQPLTEIHIHIDDQDERL